MKTDCDVVARLANVAGTQEPIYGPSAIKSVAEEAKETPYTELTRDDLKWKAMDSTSVECQTFYFMSKNGDLGMAQVIYSNVMYENHPGEKEEPLAATGARNARSC